MRSLWEMAVSSAENSVVTRFPQRPCPVPSDQLQAIFDDALGGLVNGVELIGLDGKVCFERRSIDNSTGSATSLFPV